MTREDLKSLIRECLVEIITEGSKPSASSRMSLPTQPSLRENTSRLSSQEIPRRKTVGGMSLDRPAVPRQDLSEQRSNNAVKILTSDPVLSSIFADTAATTLKEQSTAEKMRPGTSADPISLATADKEVHELFGESAHNWASIAFGGNPSR